MCVHACVCVCVCVCVHACDDLKCGSACVFCSAGGTINTMPFTFEKIRYKKEEVRLSGAHSDVCVIFLLILIVIRMVSPSRGDVAVYVFDIHQPSLPTPFYSVLVSVSVFMALSIVFHSINSPTTLRFLTLFFRSYFCLIGPFSYISP